MHACAACSMHVLCHKNHSPASDIASYFVNDRASYLCTLENFT